MAIEQYKLAKKLHENLAPALFELGQTYLEDEPNKAVDYFAQCLAIDRNDIDCLRILGRLYLSGYYAKVDSYTIGKDEKRLASAKHKMVNQASGKKVVAIRRKARKYLEHVASLVQYNRFNDIHLSYKFYIDLFYARVFDFDDHNRGEAIVKGGEALSVAINLLEKKICEMDEKNESAEEEKQLIRTLYGSLGVVRTMCGQYDDAAAPFARALCVDKLDVWIDDIGRGGEIPIELLTDAFNVGWDTSGRADTGTRVFE